MTEPSESTGSFTIQQVAKRTGISEYNLRYYEKVGLIDPIGRDDSSGHRRYSAIDIARIESLAHLRAVGLGIDEMRVMMHSRGHSPETVDTKISLLRQHRRHVDQELANLHARRRYLDNRIDYWEAVVAGDSAAAEQLATAAEDLGRALR